MMTNRRRRRHAALLIGLTLTALTAATPAAAREPFWRACAGPDTPADLECAAIEVPVDWARPHGATITLDLARLPATEPARRIGSVLGVPGGPGAKGVEDLRRAAADLTGLRRRFDLVAYNPRTSVWLDRLPPACERPATTLSEPASPKEYRALAETMAKGFEACREADPTGLFGAMDSLSVARDMDAVRRALGEERLSFMANSYGGVAAVAYARLFPQRIRAMYVDGTPDHVDGWLDQTLRTLPVRDATFTRFAAWCAATPACALHGRDVKATWRDLTEGADRTPIRATSAHFGEVELTGWHLRSFGFMADPGPENTRWLAFADAIDKAARGDGSGFADGVIGTARVWATPGILAMTCGDGRSYTGYAQLEEFRRQARRISPDFQGAAFDTLGCTGWPLPVANPSRPLPTRGLPPFLGAGSTWGDHVWTESLTGRIPGSVTVAYDGPGHALYLSGKACPIRHATSYLTHLRLPPPGTVCPAE
ncbi:alpha/beta fold hydrolase [Herbidospora sp. NEAU-GS84]|uniref:Alpha/beta fold hydrolase n=1 Tax=Herbidospora solisilvae TaxID=2696284 RepID=A0A7C9N6L6_9ACTN|nr:alpha/beta fold hydrolase [Herbidospora solisilvae]NAS26414.1 alpha/beta fold hydrolase [Herbidospora solisilvae]